MAKKTVAKSKPAAKKVASNKNTKDNVKKASEKSATKAVKKSAVKKASPKKATVKKTAKKSAPKKVVAKKTVAAKPKPNKTTSASKVKTAKVKSSSKTKSGRKVEVVVTSPRTKAVKTIKGYSKSELNEFKDVNIQKREEIIEQLQNLKDQMMDESTGQYVNENSPYSLHMAEQGTDAQEREKLYLWAQRETKFLSYLEDALARIENGTYGICIDSLELPEGPHLIPKNRLFAVPHTQHCVDCKNKKR